MKKALLSLVASLFLSITAAANTFYVSTTGADTNPGSLAQPWRTIQGIDFHSVTIEAFKGQQAPCCQPRNSSAPSQCCDSGACG